jgi:UDP-N-acetylglucosamine 2-epimerase (non-hydrolysing)
MKLSIILGTRPEIIKMSSVIRKCKQEGLDFFILHTGQHYSYNMDRIFFEKLHLPEPRFNLEIGSGSHGLQTGRMIIEIEKILVKEAPDVVLVQGDTNTVLAGAIAASKMGIKIGHVEAGLRSYDNTMPEEVNRRLADHCSDYLFAPTEKSKGILVNEGISLAKIFVTGNTIVDAVYQNLKIANNSGNILEDLGLEEKKYFLVTAHRQENVDNLENLKEIMKGLKRVSEKFGLPIIFPIHPRTKKNMEEFKIKFDFLTLIEPVDFLDFLKLESKAKLILTDSGGVQEESCILGVPCVTMRENTERPETIEVGSNLLAGIDESRILDSVECMLNKEAKWTNPFGDGKAAERIIKILNGAENERKLT